MEPLRTVGRVLGMTVSVMEVLAPVERSSCRGDDPQIVVQVAHASRNAEFAAFMAANHAALHRMAYLLCGDVHRADELTQATLERTYRSWSRAREVNPLAYARKVLANLRIDTWRRSRREVLLGADAMPDDDAVSSSNGVGGVEDRDAVVRALLLLPVKQRRVVVLRHLMELSEAETAAELGVAVGTVKSASSRGLKQLRTILEAQGRVRTGPPRPVNPPGRLHPATVTTIPRTTPSTPEGGNR